MATGAELSFHFAKEMISWVGEKESYMHMKWDEGSWISLSMLLYHHVWVVGRVRGKHFREIASLVKAER